jgi:hypothetical protein
LINAGSTDVSVNADGRLKRRYILNNDENRDSGRIRRRSIVLSPIIFLAGGGVAAAPGAVGKDPAWKQYNYRFRFARRGHFVSFWFRAAERERRGVKLPVQIIISAANPKLVKPGEANNNLVATVVRNLEVTPRGDYSKRGRLRLDESVLAGPTKLQFTLLIGLNKLATQTCKSTCKFARKSTCNTQAS